MACRKGQFDVVNNKKAFSINLNAQHVNGMTPRGKLVKIHERTDVILDTLNCDLFDGLELASLALRLSIPNKIL